MRSVVENTFGFVGSELQASDPKNHQDQAVAKDERTYFVDATDYGLSFNSQPSRHVFHLYSSCNERFGLHMCLSIGSVWQLLRSELRLPSAGRRKQRDWRLRLRPYGSWLARHTTVPGPD